MAQLFPSEIIKSSCENYFTEKSTSVQIIYLSVILFTVGSFCMLPLINVQVTTQSEGVVRSGYEDNPIIPIVEGEVIRCKITENQDVNENDTLLIIASDQINEELKLLTFKKMEEMQLFADLKKLLLGENSGLSTALCKQELLVLTGKLTEQKTQLKQAEQEFILAETLFRKGITPTHDYEKIARLYQSEINKLNSIQAQQMTIWQAKFKETSQNLTEIATKTEQLKKAKSQYSIIAPIAGTITGFSGIKSGNYIVQNQLIGKISSNNDLLVECYVAPSDIGFINNGMSVSFQFHAYNYNLWGVAKGTVKEISGNVVFQGNTPYFKVKCKLDQQFLQLKNGTKGDLIKGMTATGRFRVAERTLFQLLYDKADNWLNPKLKNI